MTETPPPDRAALAAVEEAVAAFTASLDDYERRFAGVLAGPVGTTGSRPAVGPRDDPAAGWDERIAAATRQANAIERELADGQSAWGQWREAFTAWEASVQQPGGSTAD